MKVLIVADELARAKGLSGEMSHQRLAAAETFEAGVIRFSPVPAADPKQITHTDQDVLCYILSGAGRLRTGQSETPLREGMFCHIPANTPHDFAATTEPLTLLYTLIRTR